MKNFSKLSEEQIMIALQNENWNFVDVPYKIKNALNLIYYKEEYPTKSRNNSEISNDQNEEIDEILIENFTKNFIPNSKIKIMKNVVIIEDIQYKFSFSLIKIIQAVGDYLKILLPFKKTEMKDIKNMIDLIKVIIKKKITYFF